VARPGSLTLSTLFDYLNKRRVVIAFDEAQRLRGLRSREVLELIIFNHFFASPQGPLPILSKYLE